MPVQLTSSTGVVPHAYPQTGLVPLGRDPASRLFEFGHLRSGSIPRRDHDSNELVRSEETGLVFVLLPPAPQFLSGAQRDDAGAPNYDPAATPIEGLYTCGASNYPGGMVLGGPGYIGANKVAEEMGVAKWWKPTPEMERYVRTYLE